MTNANETKAPERIEVESYSGNVKPWRARVYFGGAFVGMTGFCATAYGAQRAGERIRAQAARDALLALRSKNEAGVQ